eukprot:TRINITY_DN16177_c0_g1_i1.p1 TRINITY_DN16177_c0_g1~~TRINITY_DN16177_c0_g1_i1.p1  ORF type:complete len:137 (+),score=24.84 TRINITY_DN16177_c0_g1_i1:130-540(+)
MIRRPPRSTLSSSSAASDVYKRQESEDGGVEGTAGILWYMLHGRYGCDYEVITTAATSSIVGLLLLCNPVEEYLLPTSEYNVRVSRYFGKLWCYAALELEMRYRRADMIHCWGRCLDRRGILYHRPTIRTTINILN